MAAREDTPTPSPSGEDPIKNREEAEASGGGPETRGLDGLLLSHERVLRRIGEGPITTNDLIGVGLSQATVYRAIAALRERDFINTDPSGTHSITASGLTWIARNDENAEAEPELGIDALLACAPTIFHRDVITLGLCAIDVRFHQVFVESLLSVLLYGPPSAMKTWCARAILALAGGDIVADVVDLSAQSGRDLLVRRDSRGGEVTRSRHLALPAAVYDEADKIKDAIVWQTLENVLMRGKSTVTLGNEVYPVPVTAITTMNPLAGGEATFSAQTKLHESVERRLLVCDFARVIVPNEYRDGEKEWVTELAAMDRARRTKLPRPRSPGLRCGGRIRKILESVLRDPSILDRRVDPRAIGQLVVGATAWVSEADAFRLVVWKWCRLASLRCLLKDDWSLQLLRELAPSTLPSLTPTAIMTTPPATAMISTALVKEPEAPKAEVPESPELQQKREVERIVARDYGNDWGAVKAELCFRQHLLKSEGIYLDDGLDLARWAKRLRVSFTDAHYYMHFGRDLNALALEFGIYNQDLAYYVELGMLCARRGWTIGMLPPRRR